MSGIGHQLLHADALAAELESLGLDASLFGAAGVPAPIFQLFGAPDQLDIQVFGTEAGPLSYARNCTALWITQSMDWAQCGAGIPRFTWDTRSSGNPAFYLGLVCEPARTNECENYNASPDVALTGLTKSGDAASVMSRVEDAAALAAGEIGFALGNGYAFELDNSAGSADAFVTIDGGCPNTNDHDFKAIVRKVSGPSSPSLRASNGSFTQTFSNDYYDLRGANCTPDVGEKWQVKCPAGTVARWVMNSVAQENPVTPTLPFLSRVTPLITEGAQTVCPADTLSCGALPAGLNTSELTLLVTGGFGSAGSEMRYATVNQNMVALNNGAPDDLLSVHTNGIVYPHFQSTDGVVTASSPTINYLQGIKWKAAVRASLSAGVLQVGSSRFDDPGYWTWGTPETMVQAFPAAALKFINGGAQWPSMIRDLRIYNQCLSTAEIEAIY